MTFPRLDSFRREWLYALRSLRRTPGLTLAAVLILGLGIGVATAMVSVFDSAILTRLPVRDQDRLVVMWPLGKGGTEVPLDMAEYENLRDHSLTLAGLAGFAHWGAHDAAMAQGNRPVHLRLALVTGNFFEVLGASPVVGRLLQSRDRFDGNHVIVISYAAWQRLFGGDPAVVGKDLRWLSAATNYTIVGVAPPEPWTGFGGS